MKRLHMQKIITVTDRNRIYTVRYEGLEIETFKDKKLEVEFPKGSYSRRMKQLRELGFKLVGWTWEPTAQDPVWASYRGVFQRV